MTEHDAKSAAQESAAARDDTGLADVSPDVASAERAASAASAPGEDQQSEASRAFEELRAVLLGAERDELDQLRARLDDPAVRAAEIGSLLPLSIRRAGQADDNELINALRAPVGECIKESIQQDTRTYADALFPVMGPAIRRSISEALKGILDGINRMMDQSLSPRSMGWRWEAFKTGTSFSEIALRETLVYRVEHVFLVQPDSGLLIGHAQADGTEELDSDAVSAMLTAIGDFIQESFARGEEGELGAVEHGNRNIWVFHGPLGVMACVIRGDAPSSLRPRFRTVLEEIHGAYRPELAEFVGDRSDLGMIDAALSACLDESFVKPAATSKRKAWLVVGVLGVLLIGWIGHGVYRAQLRADFDTRLEAYVNTLDQRPGVAVSRVARGDDRNNDTVVINGFVDPLAPRFDGLAAEFELDPARLSFALERYQSLDADIVLQRATKALQPPADVSLQLNDERQLILTGVAAREWISHSKILIPALAGIEGADFRGLEELERRVMRRARERLAPPASVSLTLVEHPGGSNYTLVLEGEAARTWIESIHERLKAVKRISTVEIAELSVLEDRVLADAKALLNPPEGVDLAFADRRLTIAGAAPARWIATLGEAVAAIPEVARLDTNNLRDLDSVLVRAAIERLNPPSGVVFKVEQRQLKASGEAPLAWLETAQTKLNDDLAGLVSADLSPVGVVEAREFGELSEQLRAEQILFEVDSSAIDARFHLALDRLALALTGYAERAAILSRDAEVWVIGQTDQFGLSSRNQELRAARATAVVAELVRRGVPRAQIRPKEITELAPAAIARLPEATGDSARRVILLPVANHQTTTAGR